MTVVDTHCHAGLNWFEPVETLLHQMDANAVDKAVLIQHMGNYDNTYLLECARRFPGRFAVVVLVDTSQTDATVALARIHRRTGMDGVRTAEGGEGVTGGMIRARIWVDGRLAGGL